MRLCVGSSATAGWKDLARRKPCKAVCRRPAAYQLIPPVVQAEPKDPDWRARLQALPPATIPADRVLAHAAVDDAAKARLRQPQAVSDPVVLIAEIRSAQAELGERADRRGLAGTREPEPATDLDRFTAGLRIAWRADEQHPTHRRPYRRRKPIPGPASMLDDLREQIGVWLAEEPGLPAITFLECVKTLHPDRFTDQRERTAQRAVKQWRLRSAEPGGGCVETLVELESISSFFGPPAAMGC